MFQLYRDGEGELGCLQFFVQYCGLLLGIVRYGTLWYAVRNFTQRCKAVSALQLQLESVIHTPITDSPTAEFSTFGALDMSA